MSKSLPLFLGLMVVFAFVPAIAKADPDFTFTVPVKLTNVPNGYTPWVLCRVQEYTKLSPNKRTETAHGSQTIVPDAAGNFDGDVKIDLMRFSTPAAKPDGVYDCYLNFITKLNPPVPPNAASKLQVSGSIP